MGDHPNKSGPGSPVKNPFGLRLGIDAGGTADLGNSQSGVNIWGGASSNTIGGGVAAAGRGPGGTTGGLDRRLRPRLRRRTGDRGPPRRQDDRQSDRHTPPN